MLPNPAVVFGWSFALGLLIATIGAWIVMRAIRTTSSKFLFYSLFLLIPLSFYAELLHWYVVTIFASGGWHFPQAEGYLDYTVRVAAPAMLILGAATSLFFVGRDLGRSNNSPKLNRLLGSA